MKITIEDWKILAESHSMPLSQILKPIYYMPDTPPVTTLQPIKFLGQLHMKDGTVKNLCTLTPINPDIYDLSGMD